MWCLQDKFHLALQTKATVRMLYDTGGIKPTKVHSQLAMHAGADATLTLIVQKTSIVSNGMQDMYNLLHFHFAQCELLPF